MLHDQTTEKPKKVFVPIYKKIQHGAELLQKNDIPQAWF